MSASDFTQPWKIGRRGAGRNTHGRFADQASRGSMPLRRTPGWLCRDISCGLPSEAPTGRANSAFADNLDAHLTRAYTCPATNGGFVVRTAARAGLALITAIAAIFCAGCQQAEIIFHRHQPLTAAADCNSFLAAPRTRQPAAPKVQSDTAVLAHYQEKQEPTAASPSSNEVPPRILNSISGAAGLSSGPAPQAVETPATTQPFAPTATQPSATQPSYTAPSVAIRYTTFGVGLASAAIGVPDTVGGGREAAEAQVLGSTALLTGAPGLAAPSPTVLGTVTSAGGLRDGAAIGHGPASPNNFFTRQVNPASGPNGRNAELLRAGFTIDRIPGGGQRASRR